MNPLQIILIGAGLLLAVAGLAILFRMARSDHAPTRGPFLSLGPVAIGLIVAYRAYSDYPTLDGLDILIMFVFVAGLFGLLGLQFFVTGRDVVSRDR